MALTMYGKKSSVSIRIYFYLIYFYLLVCLVGVDPEGGGGLINQVSAGLVIAFCSVKVLFSRKTVNTKNKSIYTVMFLFFVYLLLRLAIMFMVDSRLAMSSVRNEITILFWVTSLLFCVREFEESSYEHTNKLVIGFIVLSFLVFIRSLIIEKAYYQSISTIGAVNTAGSAYMLVPLILLALRGRRRLLLYLLCLVVCALSQKRQALLGFGCVSIFVFWDLVKEYFKTFKLIGVVLLFLGLFFSGFIVNKVFSGIIERQQYLSEQDELADNGRTQIWALTLDGYSDAPLLDQIIGGGPGTGGRYMEERTGGWFVMPHNAYIEILCDYGVVGLLIFISFLLVLMKSAFLYPRGSLQRKLILCVVLSWVVTNMVSHAGRIWTICFSIAIGMIVLFDRYDEANNTR